MKVFFQIGTNDGNDEFLGFVKESNPDLIILVEPNPTHIDAIKTNYSSMKNVHIYNKAIYYKTDEEVELCIPAKNGIYGSRADNNWVYGHHHFSLVPMNDWGEQSDMVKFKTKSITFDDICKEHNITEIELLQIDTEGFDSEIIKMIDFDKYKINTIIFEKWPFKPECFTRYHADKANNLGMAGMIQSIQKLQNYNYKVYEIKINGGDNYLALRSQ